MSTYRWGIIGCGDVTEKKSGPAYQQTQNFYLHAVMRRDFAKAKDYALRHNVPNYYDDADALINNPEIDAVYIATPPDSHEYYALKIANAGKICCIEKPLAPSYDACKRIEDAFAKKNIPLFVAYYRRSLPRFLKVKSIIDSGEIGKVRHVNYLYTRTPSPVDLSGEYNWRTDKNIAFGGYFDDLASHTIDLFAFLFGTITDANGYATKQQDLYTAMDAVVGNWKHESGVTGTGSWNFSSHKLQDRVEVIGEKGIIRFAIFNEESLFVERENETEEIWVENPNPIQLQHVQNIEKHLSNIETHPSTGKTATQTSWVLDKLLGK